MLSFLTIIASASSPDTAIAATKTVEQVFGYYHATLFNFPLILFSTALGCDILFYYDKLRSLKWGHSFVVLGVIMCIPTIVTGLAASVNLDITDSILAKHRMLGYATGMFGSLYAGLRISAMWWDLPLLPKHYIGLSVMMVALISWCCDYGVLVAQGVTSIP